MSDPDATDPDNWPLADRIAFFKDASAGLKAINDNHDATVAERDELRRLLADARDALDAVVRQRTQAESERDQFRADADALALERFAMNAYCDVPAGECAATEYRALEQARKATEPALARARERGVKP